MHPSLSFEQAPPLSVPFRFFLTAPVFGIAAGLLLLFQGGEMLGSRWMPAALAGTHLIVAGFMLQAMCGALLQFVPVAAGGNIWRPRLVAGLVHPLLVAAALLLPAAFLTGRSTYFLAAAHSFAVALGIYLPVVGIALWRTTARGATIVGLRIALAGLLVTVILGITLATGLAWGVELPYLTLTDVHAAWGLGGWSLILLAAVSYFVVPMFQLTPVYPTWFARGMPFVLLAILAIWTTQFAVLPENARTALLLLGLGVTGTFAAETLHLQSRRRRKVGDTTLLFFRTAMLALLGVLVSAILFAMLPALWADPRSAVWLGMLALAGVFVSAINGMLYKIMPFLIWLHLQRMGGLNTLPPTMNLVIPELAMRRQYRAHLGALALLLVAVWLPELARVAGLAFALNCAWLGINLAGSLRVYVDFTNRIRAGA